MGGAHLGGAQMTMNAMSFFGARMTGAHMAGARMTDQFRARMAGAHLGTRQSYAVSRFFSIMKNSYSTIFPKQFTDDQVKTTGVSCLFILRRKHGIATSGRVDTWSVDTLSGDMSSSNIDQSID